MNPDGRKEPNANVHPFLRMRGAGCQGSRIEQRGDGEPHGKGTPNSHGVAGGNAMNQDRKTREGPVVPHLQDRLQANPFQKQDEIPDPRKGRNMRE